MKPSEKIATITFQTAKLNHNSDKRPETAIKTIVKKYDCFYGRFCV